MKAAVVGTGAMGGLFAARLALSGISVGVIEIAPPTLEAIRSAGLVMESATGVETVRLEATSVPEELGPADIVFFFVKAYHTAGAAEMARPLVGPQTTVVSLQNGWGNADTLAHYFPAERLVIGVTYHSATVRGPGKIAHTGKGPTLVGPYQAEGSLERAESLRELLAGAGFDTTVTPQIRTEIWKKLILNAATLPSSALTGLQAGNLGQPGPVLDVVDALAAEAVDVARAQGLEIEYAERIERIHSILAGAGTGKASMLQDVEARRKTEIEVINGAVVRAAERFGVDVPLNRVMVALIGGLERSWQQ